MAGNTPREREKRVVGKSSGVSKRGSGLGTGPVGGGGAFSQGGGHQGGSHQGGAAQGGPQGGRPQGGRPQGGRQPGLRGAGGAGGGFSLGKIIIFVIIAVVVFGGGGLGLSGGFSGGGSGQNESDTYSQGNNANQSATGNSAQNGDLSQGADLGGILSTLMAGYTTTPTDYSAGTTGGYDNYNTVSGSNTAQLNSEVSPTARQKYTSIVGSGADVVTIMVYMCGTDLESKSGMGTADLQEMAQANIGDNVNLIVYTGGCKAWKNNLVSSSVNQIFQVKKGGLKKLSENAGTGAMTDPNTLTEFIKFCNTNFPANRNELIFWDHGSGSLSGYGYDEKNPKSGSMTLAGIDTALKNAGCKFDFIGFDACLMATLENGLMLSDYADYMIASEETEPGVGWYYTNWLSKLSDNTSMPTIEIGKNIIDDFVDVCASKCRGQKATLSVTDLAELSETVPDKFNAFSGATGDLVADVNGYTKVSDARNRTKEFAQSSKIDQIDLVHFTKLLDTAEANELGEVLLSAIKYNRTEKTINNAYGLSIYFPYKKASKVSSMVNTYDKIGLDSEYSRCITAFAQNEQTGQITTDGQGSALPSLFGSLTGGGFSVDSSGSSSSGGSGYADALTTILSSMLRSGGDASDAGNGAVSNKAYVPARGFDESKLDFKVDGAGRKYLDFSDSDWNDVALLDTCVYLDDGEGFIELGLDNTYYRDDAGKIIADYDETWLSVNGQVVAYYHTDTDEYGDTYSINGYIPAFLNDERVELLVEFTDAEPYGKITGARTVYPGGETETVAKNMIALQAGDKLDFICDYYGYDGTYQDSFYLGESMTLTSDDVEIANISISDEKCLAMYKITDLYMQEYFTESF